MSAIQSPIAASEESILRCRKTTTSRKVEANRQNAKQSTGPRTKRGKRTSRFNAVTLGLFAKHVIIPDCDGYTAEKDFKSLLEALHQEYQPVGVYEEWLVVRIAECMWRLRRAARCESGAVREAANSEVYGQVDHDLANEWRDKVRILTEAENKLRDSGTLSTQVYNQLLPLVEEQVESEKQNKPVEMDFDREVFLAALVKRKRLFETYCWAVSGTNERKSEACSDYGALPSESDMDRILRYEERMYRQIDWAVQRLLECQGRRRTIHSATSVVASPDSSE